jgi:hypothetical protein
LSVVFDLKYGKTRQDQARQDGKVPTLPGQEMADPGKTESAIFFPWSMLRLTADHGDAHLDLVFLTVVNQGNKVILLVDAINAHRRLAILGRRALDGDVVDRLPIPVVPGEARPIRREARYEPQLAHLRPQSQE